MGDLSTWQGILVAAGIAYAAAVAIAVANQIDRHEDRLKALEKREAERGRGGLPPGRP